MFADEEMGEVNTFNGQTSRRRCCCSMASSPTRAPSRRPGLTLARHPGLVERFRRRGLRQIYLATYTRPPSAHRRQERLLPRLAADRSPRGYEDLFFALLTSTEIADQPLTPRELLGWRLSRSLRSG